MRITASLPDHGAIVEAILEGFVQAACVIISSGVVPPFPQMTGVKYRPESSGSEEWLLPNQVMKAGQGDCEDLSIWLAAGYRVTGQDPYARAMLVMTGDHQVHCIVELQNGQYVDPSAQARERERYEVGVVPNYGIIRSHKGNNPNAATGPDAEARRRAPPAAASAGTPNPFFVPGLKKWMDDNPKWVKDGVLTVTSPKFWDQFGPNVYQSNPAAQERLRAAVLDSPYIEAIKSGQQWAADNGLTAIPDNFGKGERVEVTPNDYGWVDDGAGGHVERYQPLPDPAAELYDPYGGVLDPYGGVYGSSIYGYDPYVDPYAQQSYYGMDNYGYAGWQSGPNPQMYTYDSLYDTLDDSDGAPLELESGEEVVDVEGAVDANVDAASTADDVFGGGWL